MSLIAVLIVLAVLFSFTLSAFAATTSYIHKKTQSYIKVGSSWMLMSTEYVYKTIEYGTYGFHVHAVPVTTIIGNLKIVKTHYIAEENVTNSNLCEGPSF